MQITVTRQQFLLVGFEMVVDFSKGFNDEMAWIRAELKRCLLKINNKVEPVRLVGFMATLASFFKTPVVACSSKGKYFYGVEVQT